LRRVHRIRDLLIERRHQILQIVDVFEGRKFFEQSLLPGRWRKTAARKFETARQIVR
jgi:hypothetical protein